MKRLTPITLLMLLLGTMLVPAQVASAQSGPDICAAARNGEQIPGYEVTWGRGGSGHQVVLGDDSDNDLRGGSGHDILCGFGGNDILRGNSGHDILVDGETNRGGSGHDSEMVTPPEPEPFIRYVVHSNAGVGCSFEVIAENLPEGEYRFSVQNNSVLGIGNGDFKYQAFDASGYFVGIVLVDPEWSGYNNGHQSSATVRIYNASGFELVETFTYAEHCPSV